MARKNKNVDNLMNTLVEAAVDYKYSVEGYGRTPGSSVLTHLKGFDTSLNNDPIMREVMQKAFKDYMNEIFKQKHREGVFEGFIFGAAAGIVVTGTTALIINHNKTKKEKIENEQNRIDEQSK